MFIADLSFLVLIKAYLGHYYMYQRGLNLVFCFMFLNRAINCICTSNHRNKSAIFCTYVLRVAPLPPPSHPLPPPTTVGEFNPSGTKTVSYKCSLALFKMAVSVYLNYSISAADVKDFTPEFARNR